MIIEPRNLPGFEKVIITLFYMIPCIIIKIRRYIIMWCNFMLRDISNEFYISQIYSSAYSFRGRHPPNQNSQNKSNKGCTFQVEPGGYTWGGPNVSET